MADHSEARPARARDDEQWPVRVVGRHLREARLRGKLTLAAVAAAAGVTKSFVSAVERGETAPSIGSLYRICDALGISMSSLFELVGREGSNVVRRADVTGTYFGGEGVVNYVLSPRTERRAQIIETRIAPGGSPGREPWSHPGELVMATVVSGTLEVRLSDRLTTLGAGDTIAYAPSEPHSWRNPDDRVAAVVLFFQIPAEY
ncbi:MAG TPA: helix-turn-helix domain-containing protein [Thermoleophilia bacterium]|nr:helix-turn-helix domain-containing protein [Thermoleophilia bacterium]